MAEEILTLGETAKALKVSQRIVQTMVSKKELKAFKLGGQWRFRRKDVDACVDHRRARRPGRLKEIIASSSAVRSKQSPRYARNELPPTALSELTERVTQERMHELFVQSLGDRVQRHSLLSDKPLVLDLRPPAPHRLRVYMFNATRPPGGRPLGEHKIQIIVPGQKRGEPGNFDNSDGRLVLLVGYSAEEQVFILWDAGLYANFAWSRNVQVKPATIIEGSAGKLARQERTLRPLGGGSVTETLIAANHKRLPEAVEMRISLTLNRLLRP